MSKRPKTRKRARGRPNQGITEGKLLVRGPKKLHAEMKKQAKEDGIAVSEAWRRAARQWLLDPAATDPNAVGDPEQ